MGQKYAPRRLMILLSVVAAMVLALTLTAFAATSSTSGGKTYYHPPAVQGSNYITFDGIDVSVFQGSINWKKVKKAGVDYAFIRIGGTYGKSTFTQYHDLKFATNVANAKAAGVNVGVYYFSLAKTTSEAKKEANWVIDNLESAGVQPTMPVVMDYEFLSGSRLSTTTYTSTASVRKTLTANAKAFMNTIKSAGYTPMFYTYRSVCDWSPRFNMDDLQDYPFWLAQYSTSNSYSKRVDYWQYTSSGSVSGISGYVDRDFYYYNLNGTGTESGTDSIRDCSVSIPYSQMAYTGSALEPDVTVKDGSKTLKQGEDYTVSYFDNLKKGTAYVVVNGIGDYSNTTSKTFTIGSSNIASRDANVTSLDKVSGFGTSVKTSSSSVALSFKAVDNAQDYQVTYRTNQGSWQSVMTGGATKYTLKLPANTAVDVKVRAVTGNVYGSYSATRHRFVGRLTSSTTVSTSNGTLKIAWKPLTPATGTMSYLVTMIDDSGKSTTATVTGNSTASKTMSAEKGGDYTIKVTPNLTIGSQLYSGNSDGTKKYRLVNKADVTSVTAPSLTSLKAAWDNIGADKYRVYICSSATSTSGAKTVETTSTDATVTGLTSGKTYYVRVRPIDTDGHTYSGELSGAVSITPSRSVVRNAAEQTLSKINSLKVKGDANEPKVTVKIGAVEGATDYELTYRKNGGDWTTVSTGGETTYTLEGDYGDCYEVKARPIAIGDSETEYGASTGVHRRAVLKRGTIKKATAGNGTITLKVSQMDCSGYFVKVSGTNFKKYYRFPGSSQTTLKITGLKAGTYKVYVFTYKTLDDTNYNGVASKKATVSVK